MYGVRSSSDRIAGMNIVANDFDGFNRKENEILKAVKVINDCGRDIMRKDLLPLCLAEDC